jgi:hypothetical protein
MTWLMPFTFPLMAAIPGNQRPQRTGNGRGYCWQYPRALPAMAVALMVVIMIIL